MPNIGIPRRIDVMADGVVVGSTPQASSFHSILRQTHGLLARGQTLIPTTSFDLSMASSHTYLYRFRVRPRPQATTFLWVADLKSTANGATFSMQVTQDGEAGDTKTYTVSGSLDDPAAITYLFERSNAKSSDVEVEVLINVTVGTVKFLSVGMHELPRPALEENATDLGTSPDRFRQDQPIYDLSTSRLVAALARPSLGLRTYFNWSAYSEVDSVTSTAAAASYTGPGTFKLLGVTTPVPILGRKINPSDTTATAKMRLLAWTDGAGTSCVFTPESVVNGSSSDTWTVTTSTTSPTWSPKMSLTVDCTDLSTATGLQGGTFDGFNVDMNITGAMTVWVAGISVWEEEDGPQVSWAHGLTYSRTGEAWVWPATYGLTGDLKPHAASIKPIFTLPTGEPAILCEGARSNFIDVPNDFTAWAEVGSASLGSVTTGPSGQEDAYELDFTASASDGLTWTDDALDSVPNNVPTVGSIYARLRSGSTGSTIRLQIADKDGNNTTSSDLTVTSEYQRFDLGDADSGSATPNTYQFTILNGTAAQATLLEISRAMVEQPASTTALFPTSWTTGPATRGATNASLASAERWNAAEPWQVRFVPEFASTEIPSGTSHYLFQVATGNSGLRVRNNGGTIELVLGDTTSATYSTRTCSWSAGDLLQVDFDPANGTYTLSGFTTGDGTVSPGAWSWDTGVTLYVGSSNGTGTSPWFGLIGEPSSL